MADTKNEAAPAAVTKELHVPEWEHEGAYKSAPSGKQSPFAGMRAKYTTFMASDRRACGLTRRMLCLVVLLVFLIILALAVGLGVGLSKSRYGDRQPDPSTDTHSGSKNQNLPLPSNSQSFKGDLTYYGTGLGACGITSADTDDIVAVSWELFDAAGSSSATGGNSNANPLCGRKIRATRYNTGAGEQRSVDLTVVDRCTGCQPSDLDTSITVFERMASVDQGRVDVTWAWLPAS